MLFPKENEVMISNDRIKLHEKFKDLKMVDYCGSEEDRGNYDNKKYQFQHSPEDYHEIVGQLAIRGNKASETDKRISITSTMNLKKFINTISYDPSRPPTDDYQALEMVEAHERTQSDFKGAKAKNRSDFLTYLIEGGNGERSLNLPVISGWQSQVVFDKAIFVIYDNTDPDIIYGKLYIPKSPIMQSDGQTQTAALFGLAKNKEAVDNGALSNIVVTVEIELGVTPDKAGQSFADRNGRGSKKNKNLVISMDVAGAISKIRLFSIKDTVFENRIADGRSGSANISMTSVENIVDLSTMEQLLLVALTGVTSTKSEHIKHHHLPTLQPFAKEFLDLLDECFGKDWLSSTPVGQEPYRKIFVHGWPFALKGIAMAYFRANKDRLGPIATALRLSLAADRPSEELFLETIEANRNAHEYKPVITFDELKNRLKQINWVRHKKHWVAITGFAVNQNGLKRIVKLKSFGSTVKPMAGNTADIINSVANKITGSSWKDLTADIDEPIS